MVLIVVTGLLTGCAGAQETDQVAYAVAIGLDLADEPEKVSVTYQIAVPRALTAQGNSGKEGASVLMTIKAHNLAAARDFNKSIAARIPNLSHTKVFIIGEDLARKGIGKIMGPIMRFREFRGSMFIIIVKGDKAANFMEKNKPPLETLPSRYYETMLLSYTETGYFLPSNLHDFYTRLRSHSGAPYATLVGINPNTGEGQPSGTKAPLEKVEEYLAGDMPRQQRPISQGEFAGTAIFKADRMVDTLTTEETRMVAILQGKMVHGFIVVQDPLEPKDSINVAIRLGRQPKLAVALADGQARITADVFLEGEISSISSGLNYEARELRPLLEDQISQLIEGEMRKMLVKTQASGSDIVGFGFRARPLFATYQDYQQTDWSGLYQEAQIEVKVTTRLRRTGLTWRTFHTKDSK